MRKILAVLLPALMLVGGMGVKVYAADNDSFTITAQVNSTLAIVCMRSDDVTPYGTWAAGQKPLSAATPMLLTEVVKIVNTSTVAINLSGTAANSAAWSADTAIGVNKYMLKLKSYAAAPADDATLATALNTATAVVTSTIFGNIATPATNSFLYVQFTNPTASTSGSGQSIGVTITATVL
ncbi:MAG: hypothetical protein A2231_11170 [Candidatus Firestonebacteria bacterium RIFOXYA2_FULL_40_8]|nr:MAG: hypothetical protein A2231_11170 [Candidatus Firestonebacteria bacterium RIFOXYA2_FULL_40_8]